MKQKFERNIFRQGSSTHYFSARFFPKKIRRDIFRLYSFVRVAGDYVDKEPRQTHKLAEIEKSYHQALKADHFDPTTHEWDDTDTKIVKNMMRLVQRYKFDPAWVDAFLTAIKQDIKPVAARKLDDSLKYVYGSAEVIGLMMARIMRLPEESYEAAKLQGRAMQWINFLRDLKADSQSGRQYFPQSDLDEVGLPELSEEAARANPKAFDKLVKLQLKRYRQWQAEAAKGFSYIPRRLLVALQTAVDMYNWTADQIEKDPMIVWRKKVKPRKVRVVARGVRTATASDTRRAIQVARRVRQLRPNELRQMAAIALKRLVKKV